MDHVMDGAYSCVVINERASFSSLWYLCHYVSTISHFLFKVTWLPIFPRP